MYTLSLAVKSMCCKKTDYMHTNLSSLYTTGFYIATSACKAKKAFASLFQPMKSVGKLNISFEYQMYSDIGFFNIIDDIKFFQSYEIKLPSKAFIDKSKVQISNNRHLCSVH